MLEGLLQTHEGAQRRVTNGDEIEAHGENSPEKSQNGGDKSTELSNKIKKLFFKEFAPIFRSRLRDGYFSENSPSVYMECQPIG